MAAVLDRAVAAGCLVGTYQRLTGIAAPTEEQAEAYA